MPPKKLLELEALIRDLLSGIGEDPDREGLRETPRRMVEMLDELTQGYRISPEEVVAGAIFPVEYDEMVVLKDISFYSLCVHGKSMVYTPQGARFAKAMRPGQKLFTLNPATKELELTEVLAVSRTKHRERYHLVFEGGHLRATGEHPVYILNKGFVPVREVHPGDHLLGVYPKKLHAHMIISANRPFLERLGELLDAKVGQQQPGIGRLYVSPRWFEARRTRQGFKHGFQPEPQAKLLKAVLERVQTKIYLVKAVQRERATLKSFTMYNFECAPQDSYLVNGILAHNCEHHIIPFFGKIHVGYIPNGRVIGTSKIPRIIEVFAKRLQLQERMTEEIARFLEKTIKPLGVGVVAEGLHLCMAMRGVRKEEARLITSAMKGSFRKDPRTRAEFLQLIGHSEFMGM